MSGEESEVGLRQIVAMTWQAFKEKPLYTLYLILTVGPILLLAHVAHTLEWLYR